MVTAPPQIISEWSSDDVVVVEGNSIALACNVTGEPHPEVTWYRRPLSSSNWPADAESKWIFTVYEYGPHTTRQTAQ